MKKMVNGAEVEMSAQEEADFIASITPTLDQAKQAKRQAIVSEWTRREDKGYVFDVPGNMNAYLANTPNNARALKASLDAATTVEQVNAINEKAGWP